MTETQLLTFGTSMGAAFAWIWLKHDSSRLTRAIGVAVIIGAWVAYRAIAG